LSFFQERHLSGTDVQPAYLSFLDAGFRLGQNGDVSYLSRGLPADILVYTGDTLGSAQKSSWISQLKSENYADFSYNINLGTLQFRVGKVPFSVSFGQRSKAYTRFSENTAKLILNGNKQFAGQTIYDSTAGFSQFSVRHLTIGSAWKAGKLIFGGKVKLLQGSSFGHSENLDYSLYTHVNGEKVTTRYNYNLFFSEYKNLSDSKSYGFAIDLGAEYAINDKLNVGFTLSDLGAVKWEGYGYKVVDTVAYNGFEIPSLLTDDLDFSGIIQSQIDSLKDKVLKDSVVETSSYSLPAFGSVYVKYNPGANTTFLLSCDYQYNTTNEFFTDGLIGNLAINQNLNKKLALGFALFYGGHRYSGFSWSMSYTGERTRIFVALQNPYAMFSPNTAYNAGASAGWSFQFKNL
jgi:hypothetical protein